MLNIDCNAKIIFSYPSDKEKSYEVHSSLHLNFLRERLVEYLKSKKNLQDFVALHVWKEIENLTSSIKSYRHDVPVWDRHVSYKQGHFKLLFWLLHVTSEITSCSKWNYVMLQMKLRQVRSEVAWFLYLNDLEQLL